MINMDNDYKESLEFYKSIVDANTELCISMHVLDLKTEEVFHIKTNEHINKLSENCRSLQEKMNKVMINMALHESVDQLRVFVDLSTLPERLKDKSADFTIFHGKYNGWSKAVFVKMPDSTGDAEFNRVLFAVFNVDKEVTRLHELEKLQAENKKLNDIVNALMDDYSTICNVDFETDKAEIVRIAERVKQTLGLEAKKTSFKAVSLFYINNAVHEDDRAEVIKFMDADYIKSLIEVGGSIKKTFRNNLGIYGEMKIVRTGENTALFGFAKKE